jgi:hypothetical protein
MAMTSSGDDIAGSETPGISARRNRSAGRIGVIATQSPVPWWGPKVTQPSCRACGYAVQRLPSFTCPECRSDLREVGIDTPGMVPLFVRYLKAVGSVVRGEARALGHVLTLGGPASSRQVVIETR